MSELITNNIVQNQSVYNNQLPQQNSNGNFGAVDINSVKQDTVELAQKTSDEIKNENWLFRNLRNLGVKDPKKFLISAGFTLATVVGCAVLGNKMSDKTAKWGLKVDEKILGKDGNSIFARIGKGLSGAKKSAIKFARKHSKTVDDIADTMQNRMAKPKSNMTRGYGRGFVSIFSLTPVDILEKAFSGDIKNYKKLVDNPEKQAEIASKIKDSLSKLVGSEADTFVAQILGTAEKLDNREACSKFSEAFRKNFNLKTNKEFLEKLLELKAGKIDGAEIFTKVKMVEKSANAPIASWWPVNIIRGIASKFKKDTTIGLGNLGDSLIKFNAVNGTLADTKLGSLVQKSITVPTESISNFVNDKSGLGVLLCGSILSTFNNAQDAPKDKKVGTIADDFVGTIGSLAVATPLAFKTTYGLASLNNLKGNSLITKVLKKIGGIFNMGLKEGSKFIPRKLGGALRFGLIMFVFSSMFSKPIKKVIHKIFGEPYDPSAQENKNNSEINNQPSTEQVPQVQTQDSQTSSVPVSNDNANQQSAARPTNLIDIYTNNNKNSDLNSGISSQPVQPVAANPLNTLQPDNVTTQDDAISASNLTKKDKRYIPSIEVSYQEQKGNNEADPQVDLLLKKADKVIDNVNKVI